MDTKIGRASRGRRATTILAIVAMTATAAGCGGKDGVASGEETASTPGTVSIGVLVNASGPTTTGEESAPVILRAWADAVNAAGGVAGHRVRMSIVDTKGDAPTATAAVQRMAHDKSVVAMALYDASTEGVVAGAITKVGIPVIGGMGYAPTVWGKSPDWLPLTTSFPSVINMGMMLAKEIGSTKTVFPVCAENSSCAAAGPVAEKASKALGMGYVGTLPLSVSAPDYTAACLKIKERGVDYVMLGLTTTASMRLVANCRTQGYNGKWGLFDGSVWPKVMKANDPGVPIQIALSAFPWFVDDAPVTAYRQMMTNRHVTENAWGTPHGTSAYATMQLFKKALEAARPSLSAQVTRKGVATAYGTIQNETLDGLLPQPVTFRPGRPQQPVNCYWLATYEHGTFSGAELGKPVCDPPALTGTH
ncbi:ABC transporter substrate-binding protein [Actinomadura soli]|nr:ABC transporter substrate-binding protein [Actinomadura soli]